MIGPHVIVTELIGGATARLAFSSTAFPLPALPHEVRRALRARM